MLTRPCCEEQPHWAPWWMQRVSSDSGLRRDGSECPTHHGALDPALCDVVAELVIEPDASIESLTTVVQAPAMRGANC